MMVRISVVVGLLLMSAAHAQTATPVNPPVEFTIKVTGPEVDLIGKGLGSLPFNDVAPLMGKLRQQIMEQQQPPAKPKVDGAPEPDKPK